MNILITGGAGYIGSIITNYFCQKHNVIVLDDLSEGHKHAVNPLAKFIRGSITNRNVLDKIFKANHFDVVIHLAAKVVVSESVLKPSLYKKVNTTGTINILNVMKKYHCKNIIFASSAAVYGRTKCNIISEDTPQKPCNPYGLSKLNAEKKIIYSGLNYYILRFFNVSGASSNHKYGYQRSKPTLLIPSINQRLMKNQKPIIFGTNYSTKDGSCIRDYISVNDIINMISLCLDKIRKNKQKSNIFNLGSSKPYSVIEVIKQTFKIHKKQCVYDEQPSRLGDPPVLFANINKAKQLMN
jgi:UDP-glucose 4-epimerase